MALILSIESGTGVCSVGISRDGEMIAIRESFEGRDHARQVATFTDEVMRECGVTAAELDGVAVSKGPGSYTGLRIGVSFAKGICYGHNIPLIGVGSLEALTAMVNEGDCLVPMIDARRMEVYTQVFNANGVAESEVSAEVIDENSFAELKDRGEVVIFGDGAEKCREILCWARYIDIKPSAKGVAKVAEAKLAKGEREDVAYFEPFYLKDVVITKSTKKLF